MNSNRARFALSSLTTFILLIVSMSTVSARDLPIIGGKGGGTHRVECKEGYYLVGFYGQVGDFFDSVGPICRKLVEGRSLSLGATVHGATHGGSGGRTMESKCQGNESAVKAIKLNTTAEFEMGINPGGRLHSDVEELYVDNLQATCAHIDIRKNKPSTLLITSNDKGVSETKSNLSFLENSSSTQSCPGKDLATGIRVRSGHFVDGIGLICGPAPVPPAYQKLGQKKIGHLNQTASKQGRIDQARKTGDLNKKTTNLSKVNLPVAKIGRALPRPVQSKQTIQCSSSGQKCNKYAKIALPKGAPKNWEVTLKAPAAHCSSVSYRVTEKDGGKIGETPYLSGGQSGTISVPARNSTIRIYARGKKGGCNTGKLLSWGVEATAKPK